MIRCTPAPTGPTGPPPTRASPSTRSCPHSGQFTVQARYEPQRGLAPGASRSSAWQEDLGVFPGPESLAQLEGQVVTLEYAGLAADMFFSELRVTPRRYIDPNGNEPVGAPIYVDVVMTFAETDPENRLLGSVPPTPEVIALDDESF